MSVQTAMRLHCILLKKNSSYFPMYSSKCCNTEIYETFKTKSNFFPSSGLALLRFALNMNLAQAKKKTSVKLHLATTIMYIKDSWSLDCLLVPKISKRRFFRDISNSCQWVTQMGLELHQKKFFFKFKN